MTTHPTTESNPRNEGGVLGPAYLDPDTLPTPPPTPRDYWEGDVGL